MTPYGENSRRRNAPRLGGAPEARDLTDRPPRVNAARSRSRDDAAQIWWRKCAIAIRRAHRRSASATWDGPPARPRRQTEPDTSEVWIGCNDLTARFSLTEACNAGNGALRLTRAAPGPGPPTAFADRSGLGSARGALASSSPCGQVGRAPLTAPPANIADQRCRSASYASPRATRPTGPVCRRGSPPRSRPLPSGPGGPQPIPSVPRRTAPLSSRSGRGSCRARVYHPNRTPR